MNKFIFLKKIIFSLLFFSYLSVSSQDVITKNDGSDIESIIKEITIWSSHAWFSSSRINLFSNTVSHNKKSQILQNEVNNQFSTEKTLIGSDGFFSSDDFIIGQSINVILDDGTSFSGKVLNNKPKMLVFKENNGSRRLFWYTEIKEAYEM